jgi:UDP-glucuronate 4-epimerase
LRLRDAAGDKPEGSLVDAGPGGKVLVTGAAGFIGYHLSSRLLSAGCRVVGLDNLNDYYDVRLKEDRLARLTPEPAFRFVKGDVACASLLVDLFEREGFTHVIHLAAQAGVQLSLRDPHAYVHSNVSGFLNVLEACRHHPVSHLVFASSSSVYGLNGARPSSVHHPAEHPISVYAATKKSNELMAHSYSHLFDVPVTGLRFFTVYGPWGRPDMALFLFTRAILAGEPIDVFNRGESTRSFTYIDDVVEGVHRLLFRPPEADPAWRAERPDPGSSSCRYRIYNLGNDQTVELNRFIGVLEGLLDRKAIRRELPPRPGDVPATWADIQDLERAVAYRPRVPIEEGVARFVAWYRSYYRV